MTQTERNQLLEKVETLEEHLKDEGVLDVLLCEVAERVVAYEIHNRSTGTDEPPFQAV